MIKSKKQMFTVIGVFALILMLTTVTYAFFNYTRTGTANTIKTGRIAFNAEQGDTVTLDGLFPITTTGEITASTPGVGSLSIHVTGDTTYNEGIEYLVKAVNVTGSNGTSLPISVKIEYTANNNKTIGTADDSYYTNRGGNSSIYKLLSTDTIENNGDLVVGYIAPGQTGIDGNITIMAWLDAANIAITDTIEGGNIEVPGHDNGTDIDWIDGRTVFTTEEWNALTASGVSFQVKVEANEGIWVPSQLPSTATFDTGTVVNTKLKQIFLTGTPNENANVQTGNYVDYFLVSSNDIIELTDEIPNVENFVEKNIISSADSEETIYAWLDGCDGQYMNSYCKIKIYSPATKRMQIMKDKTKKIIYAIFAIFLFIIAIALIANTEWFRKWRLGKKLSDKYGVSFNLKADEQDPSFFSYTHSYMLTSDDGIRSYAKCDWKGKLISDSYAHFYYANDMTRDVESLIGSCFDKCYIVIYIDHPYSVCYFIIACKIVNWIIFQTLFDKCINRII